MKTFRRKGKTNYDNLRRFETRVLIKAQGESHKHFNDPEPSLRIDEIYVDHKLELARISMTVSDEDVRAVEDADWWKGFKDWVHGNGYRFKETTEYADNAPVSQEHTLFVSSRDWCEFEHSPFYLHLIEWVCSLCQKKTGIRCNAGRKCEDSD